MSNKDVLFEMIVENPIREMRKIAAGLVYCALLTVYEEDKLTLLDFFKKKSAPNTTARFILMVVSNMFNAKEQYPAYTNSIYGVLVRFANMGLEAKEFLLRCKMVGRCL